MGLSLCRNRTIQVAVLAAWMLSSGCQRLPYLDQTKPVPHDKLGRVAVEDKEVKRAQLLARPCRCRFQGLPSQGPQTIPSAGNLADDAPGLDPDRPG